MQQNSLPERAIAARETIADLALRHADSEAEQRACYAVMKQLRPHLENEADFMQRITRMAADSYRMLAAWEGGEVVAIAGYRLQENLVYGKFLYVDDLISAEHARGQRWGARLLDALTILARAAACRRLVLDTGLSNALAQRFYFRQGLLSSSMRFGKQLDQ
ncbi:GNAT family N-acetyltransferase [Herbaspirillum lusitanum]|uniref:GNAT family N-acetyltransferase n=1 Tax=Herbaspirillum lusitanum TaxID=213312 RepID=A0ABW9AEE4_9BURK